MFLSLILKYFYTKQDKKYNQSNFRGEHMPVLPLQQNCWWYGELANPQISANFFFFLLNVHENVKSQNRQNHGFSPFKLSKSRY